MSYEELDEGLPPPGALRLRVEAAGVNFFETLLMAGTYQVRPAFPFVPGWEAAGTVVHAPAGSGFGNGDRVVAILDSRVPTAGSYAEFADADPARSFHIPDQMEWSDAAGFLIDHLTAHLGLHQRGQLEAGQIVVIHGASGGVGSAAVALAKLAGATVVATTGSKHKIDFCRGLGADHVVDHTSEELSTAVKQATGGRGADVVFDTVGGTLFTSSTRCIAFEGRVIVVGFTSGEVPAVPANHLLLKNYTVAGMHLDAYLRRSPAVAAKAVAELFSWYELGLLRPAITATRPMSAAADALCAVATRSSTGKTVLLAGG